MATAQLGRELPTAQYAFQSTAEVYGFSPEEALYFRKALASENLLRRQIAPGSPDSFTASTLPDSWLARWRVSAVL